MAHKLIRSYITKGGSKFVAPPQRNARPNRSSPPGHFRLAPPNSTYARLMHEEALHYALVTRGASACQIQRKKETRIVSSSPEGGWLPLLRLQRNSNGRWSGRRPMQELPDYASLPYRVSISRR
jgi:hypothetical protein